MSKISQIKGGEKLGTKTRRSLSEADYSSIEVGELVKKTDQGKKRYALKKDGGRIYMTEIPLPGKDPDIVALSVNVS